MALHLGALTDTLQVNPPANNVEVLDCMVLCAVTDANGSVAIAYFHLLIQNNVIS